MGTFVAFLLKHIKLIIVIICFIIDYAMARMKKEPIGLGVISIIILAIIRYRSIIFINVGRVARNIFSNTSSATNI